MGDGARDNGAYECDGDLRVVKGTLVILGEELHSDGDFSGYVEDENASTRRGFIFSNWLGNSK